MKKCFFIVALLLVSVLSVATFADVSAGSQQIVKFGKDITIAKGDKVESVVAIGGNITIKGDVKKDAVAIGGSIILSPGAKVGGDIVEINNPWMAEALKRMVSNVPAVNLTFTIITNLATLVLLVLLAVFFPQAVKTIISFTEKNFWKNTRWGFLGVVLVVPIIILLIISLLGIILIPVFILLVAAAYIFSYTCSAGFLGKKIFKAFKAKKNKPLPLEVAVGALLLILVNLVPIIGWLVKFVIILAGLGGVILTRFGIKPA